MSAEARDAELHPVDAWWTVLAVDPLAVPLVRLVTPWRWVTPMRLTVTAHFLGVVTAVLFALGHPLWAAVLYEIRFVIDCMDGKLARRRRTTSAVGAHLDFVGDYVVTTLNLTGLGLWLAWAHDTSPALALAPAIAFALHMAVRLSTEMQEGTMWRASEAMPGRYVRWMAARRLVPAPSRIDVEHGFLFVVPLLAAALDEVALVQVAAGAVAAYFTYVGLRFLRGGLALAAARDRQRDGGARA
ncbi:MAG TPA: CDP-alcohol phosphatidyltransferase family protein [Acidimicrobiales bacterium]|nr:CDP-alcohol phosphatidyltransferase family protein [Acidimicrobiales bacterium]